MRQHQTGGPFPSGFWKEALASNHKEQRTGKGVACRDRVGATARRAECLPWVGLVVPAQAPGEGARGEREIGPQRPQICPLSDSGRMGGARVAAAVRRALRAALSVPAPERGPPVAAPAHEPTVQACALVTATPWPALCRMVASGDRAMGCRGEALTARKRSLHKCAFASLRGNVSLWSWRFTTVP